MDYVVLAIFCLYVGNSYGKITTTIRFKELLDSVALDNGIDINQRKNLAKQQIPFLVTEKHGDMLYLYEKDTDTFMCQGSTLEILVEKLSEYKDIHIALVEHDTKPIWFVNGEIKDKYE